MYFLKMLVWSQEGTKERLRKKARFIIHLGWGQETWPTMWGHMGDTTRWSGGRRQHKEEG